MEKILFAVLLFFAAVYGVAKLCCWAINVCAEEEERELSGLIEED